MLIKASNSPPDFRYVEHNSSFICITSILLNLLQILVKLILISFG